MMIPEGWTRSSVRAIASSSPNAIVGGPFGSELVSQDYVPHGIPVIRGLNMGGRWVSGDFVFVSPTKAKALKANQARPGDVIFTQRGTLGQVSLVPETPFPAYVVSQSQMKLSVDRRIADPLFVFYSFTSREQQELILGSVIQTGVPHINLGILRSLPVQLPPLRQQLAIAAVLSDVDELIGSLEALVAKKQEVKQAAMQQLITGRTRLPRFVAEWKYRRLGSMLSVRHGRDHQGFITRHGRYPLLGSGGLMGRTNRSICSKPSVLIGRKGTINRPQFMSEPFWAVDTLFYTHIRPNVSAKFLYYVFCQIDWLSHNEASGLPSLNSRTIEQVVVSVPSLPEQQAIATVLSDMDAEIAALEQRLDKTHAIKQGMMQQLLTGSIRLPIPRDDDHDA